MQGVEEPGTEFVTRTLYGGLLIAWLVAELSRRCGGHGGAIDNHRVGRLPKANRRNECLEDRQ